MSQFSPTLTRATGSQVTILKNFLEKGSGRTLLITGAGLSTESGIPDYRSPNGSYSRGHKPVTYQEFTTDVNTRKRYWARSVFGIRHFQQAIPNQGHHSITLLQQSGYFNGVITQNVDRLHKKAGLLSALELHGHNEGVKCLSCSSEYSRRAFTESLADRNYAFINNIKKTSPSPEIRADGDAELDRNTIDFSGFEIIDCYNCGGVLMPTVVFFGGSIDSGTKNESFELLQRATQILVLGSSVQTFSVFRLLRDAKKEGKDIGIVTIGGTRADAICSWKIECSISDILKKATTMLGV